MWRNPPAFRCGSLNFLFADKLDKATSTSQIPPLTRMG
jgi:hypothetical protein